MQRKMTRREFLGVCLVIFMSLIGIGGFITKFLSLAATNDPSGEAEDGTAPSNLKVNDTTASGGAAIKFSNPTSSSTAPLVGCYISGDSDGTAVVNAFGHQPEIMSWYLQTNQQSFSTTNMKSALSKGTSLLITITAKSTPSYLVDISNKSGDGWSWMQTYVSGLKSIAATAKAAGLKVYATIDHEFEVKINQGTIPGADVSYVQYAKAISNFADYCRANAPDVVTLWWAGESDQTHINQIGNAITSMPDMVTFDPYASKGSTATFDSVVSRAVSNVKNAAWYNGEPIAITETGQSSANDASMAAFYTGWHAKAAQYGLEFIMFFDSTGSGLTTAVTASNKTTYPQTVSAFAASLNGA